MTIEVRTENYTYADEIPNLREVKEWAGAGMVANDRGDLYGTSPARIIRSGKAVIDGIRLEGAIAAGWRLLSKAWPDVGPGEFAGAEACDPDFAWIERTEAERTLRDIV